MDLASTEWRITSAQQIVRLSRVKPIAVGAEGASIKNIDDENLRPNLLCHRGTD